MFRNPEIRGFVENQLTGGSSNSQERPPVLDWRSDLEHGGIGYHLGSQIPRITRTPLFHPLGRWLASLGVNTPNAALGGALMGGLAGAGYGMLNRGPMLRSALLGAGAGAGGSALLSELVRGLDAQSFRKTSSYYGDAQPPIQFIQSQIFSDSNLGGQEKNQLLSAVTNLSSGQAAQLASLLRVATGVGAGLIVARFLLKLGGLGSLLLGLAGGAVGAYAGHQHNAYGEGVDPETDVFGQRHLV